MTVDEVAEKLDITPQRVREYCRAGRLGEKVGRQWIITEEEFERFLREDYTGEPGRPSKE